MECVAHCRPEFYVLVAGHVHAVEEEDGVGGGRWWRWWVGGGGGGGGVD